MFKKVLMCLILSPFMFIKAQDNSATIEQIIADIFEQYSEESDEDIDYETFYDELKNLSENPIDLNNTDREKLEKIPFLSDIQIENILSFCFSFGAINTIYELQIIDGLDMTDIRRLLPFVFVGTKEKQYSKIYWNDIKKFGRNEIFYRVDRGIELRKGYKEFIEENEIKKPTYNGSPFYNSLKYNYKLKDRILFGLTMEKDAGESFLSKTNKAYDFYSFHAQINNIGKFKTIVAGDFRASFGMGLVISQAMSMGKSSYVLNIIPRNTGLKKFSSTDENNFLRGTGLTYDFGKFNFSAFYSNKMIDADTINNSFSSIYKTGLHRTTTEINKKHTLNEQLMGANLIYKSSNYQIGFTMTHTWLNMSLVQETNSYNKFYFSGKKLTNAGLSYRFRLSKFNFFGETAIAENLSLATINGVLFSPISQISIVALYRNYSPKYISLFSNSFSESSGISNEKGTYIGTEILPFRKWKVSIYADSYRFTWPKFGIDAPSLGHDYLLQLDYAARRDVNMFWRIRFEEKEKNYSAGNLALNVIRPYSKSSIRYQTVYTYKNFSFKNVIECNLVKHNEGYTTYGITAIQDLSYRLTKIPLKFDFRYQFFDAQDYDNRFYIYEKDILYAFSIPMMYRKGSRFYFNLKYEMNENISLWFKYSQTVYSDDTNTIGSGNDEIIGNRKNDLRCMFLYNF